MMQQDRLIGAAGEGRYAEHRAWAGRPEYGNSLLVREPLVGRDVERLDLGLGRSALRAAVVLPGGRERPRRRDPPPPPRRPTRPSATSRPAAPRLARRVRPRPTRRSRSATSTPSRPSRRTPGWSRPASGRPMPRPMARSRRSPGRPGCRRPAMDTDGEPGCLDYIWLRGAVAGRRGTAGVRPPRSGATRRSTRATTSASRPPRDRLRRPLSARPPRRLAARPGEHASPRCTRRWPCRPATASSSTSGCRPTASRSSSTTRPCERVQGRPERPDEVSARDARGSRRPDPGRRPRARSRIGPSSTSSSRASTIRAVVEVLAAGRGPDLVNAVVSSFEPATLERVAGLAPAWPRWLNAETSTPATIALAPWSSSAWPSSAEWHAIDAGSVARGSQRPGSSSWPGRSGAGPRTVGSHVSGVIAVCVEAAALDG